MEPFRSAFHSFVRGSSVEPTRRRRRYHRYLSFPSHFISHPFFSCFPCCFALGCCFPLSILSLISAACFPSRIWIFFSFFLLSSLWYRKKERKIKDAESIPERKRVVLPFSRVSHSATAQNTKGVDFTPLVTTGDSLLLYFYPSRLSCFHAMVVEGVACYFLYFPSINRGHFEFIIWLFSVMSIKITFFRK